MRIADAQARPARLEFASPIRTSRGDFAERRVVLFSVRDAEGRRGYGEAAPWPGFGTETVEEAASALAEAARLLQDTDIEPGDWPVALALRLRNTSAARAAVQGALWDLAARRESRTLAARLAAWTGRRAADGPRAVAAHALLVAQEPAELRAEAAHAMVHGFRAVKLKVGSPDIARDVERVRAVREAVGPDLRIRADANGAWREADAVEALDLLAPFDLDFVEQPLPAGDLAGLARLCGRSPVRIALDETVATEEAALRVIADRPAQVMVVKPATLGGAGRALEIALMAREAGCEVVVTHAFESAVGARHALHCAAALDDATSVHGVCTGGLFARDLAEPVACRDGRAAVDSVPGIGISP